MALSSRRPVAPRRWAFLGALVLGACGGPTTAPGSTAITVDRVDVAPASAVLTALGESVQLSATALTDVGTVVGHKTFTWSSSDTNVATVSSEGLVTAAGPGTVTITATTDRTDGTATVTVTLSP